MPRLGADVERNSEIGAPPNSLTLTQPLGKDDSFLLHGDDLLGDSAAHLIDKFDCSNGVLGDWSFPGNSDALLPSFSSVLDIPLSNSNGTSTTTTTTGNIAETGQKQKKKRNMNPEQKEKMLERQRRYRKRKQQSLSEMTKSLEMQKKELEYLRARNAELGQKSAALEKMIDYATEAISVCKREDADDGEANPELVDSRVRYLMEVFDKAVNKLAVPDEHTVTSVIQTVQERNVWRRDIAIAKLQQRISNMMMRWFSCEHERKDVEDQMVILMKTRFKIADRMVQIAPSFVIDRLADGWVGQSFNEGLLVNNPVRVDDNAIEVLKESMEVTPAQQLQLNRIWKDFCHVWNGIISSLRLQIFEASGMDKTNGDASNDLEYPGLHHGMLNLLLDSDSVRKMIEMNREQIRSLLSLSKELVESLHPLQFGKVLTFLPGHGPNIMYLSKVLSRHIEPSPDVGHVVF
ncbi:hypothetical protein PSENEW3n2_00005168 [Picochlorum sp. SENEW3]|nr:hypothetical protein PSENEW3n2_00005168 [Picochlorum sp. SENEW3]WPT17163.1 hypothetical protein PSENEW3_00005168 [Picochlorum sp. SENEW3]